MEEQLRFMDHMTAAAIDMAIRFGPKVLVARRNIVIPSPQREIRIASSSTAYLAAPGAAGRLAGRDAA